MCEDGTKTTLIFYLLMEKPLGGYFQVKSPYYSPQDSPRQLAIAEGFAKTNSVFIVITSAKILPR